MLNSQIAKNYNTAFPDYPKLVCDKNWVYGIWMVGNYYKRKHDYYGSYPPSYLKRIYSMFPDNKKILHLFSGAIDEEDSHGGVRFDIKQVENYTDVVGDVREIQNFFKPSLFDLILADPPYSKADFEKYGNKTVNKMQVLKNIYPLLVDGGYLVWLDLMTPIYRKDMYDFCGTIGLYTGTNRKIRLISIFKKV